MAEKKEKLPGWDLSDLYKGIDDPAIEKDLEKSNYILEININDIGLFDSNKIEKCFEIGYETMKRNLTELKNILYY